MVSVSGIEIKFEIKFGFIASTSFQIWGGGNGSGEERPMGIAYT